MTGVKPLTDVFYLYVPAEQMAGLQKEDFFVARKKSIHAAFLKGQTYKSIALKHGISISRVHQIIRKRIYHDRPSAWEQKIAQRLSSGSEPT